MSIQFHHESVAKMRSVVMDEEGFFGQRVQGSEEEEEEKKEMRRIMFFY